MENQQFWHNAKRILCVRLDTIGDVIMTTPAIRALKTSDCDRHITLMTSSAGAVVAPLLPDIDDLIVYDSPWLKATVTRQNSDPEYAIISELRARNFDAAVIFTVYSQSPLPTAFLCYMAGIPLRLAHCHENPYQLLTNWIKDPEPENFTRHEVQRQLDLVASVGSTVEDKRLRVQISEIARKNIQNLLEEIGINFSQPWIIMHPGATAISRRYPPESFAIAARKLVEDYNIQVIFTGIESEIELVESIRLQMRSPSFCLVNKLNLSQLAALLEKAHLLISNNTAPVHIAAAVGTPVVDLYALTNPQHTPWEVLNRVIFHDVPCRICYKSICPEGHYHCLRLVEPERVVNAALELLQVRQPAMPVRATNL
ncbi:glycosyltransferase family 9 protein [Scytonema millei]|uniref:Glycosyltransferase family 9 protein n=1 Tax=Scytonema millei VB511283 TaxID=1245923 RepID=A0A9X5E4K9_9CYAN|nr:glycosyltransferase family 9 protein [Scytonema millei]NHC34713.1 glycosyltransferase family 9 protein [Scytonema millei VB511283]